MSARPASARLLSEPVDEAAVAGAAGVREGMSSTVFEFVLDPAAARALLRHPAIGRLRQGRARPSPATLLFHDAADGRLAAAGLTVVLESCGRSRVERLEQIVPGPAQALRPAGPLPVLAKRPNLGAVGAAGLAEAARVAPALLTAVAAAVGRRTVLRLATAEPMTLTLFAGHLRTLAAERPFARLTLSVPSSGLAEAGALLRALAETLPLTVPAVSLGEEARALALGVPARPLRRGAPDLAEARTVEDGAIQALGHLSLALAAAAPVAAQGTDPEGVHQARVAIRRLRSAMTVFRPAIGSAAIDDLKARAGEIARTLGPARDWDVFLAQTLAPVRATFAERHDLAALGKAAQEARTKAYRAVRCLIQSSAFRLFLLDMALMLAERPWRSADGAEKREQTLETPLADFAAVALDKRLKRVRRAGESFATLDIPALHALRIDAKRLRYAAELFAPLYPEKRVRRFLKSLAALQDALGHLNDGASAAGLLEQLRIQNAPRAQAIGVVEGWVGRGAMTARTDAVEAWQSFLKREPFWRD